MTRTLSKSKLIAYCQCPKRLWLELHQPELRTDSTATQASFATGNQVGSIARQLYDPKNKGVLIDIDQEGFKQAFTHTQSLLQTAQPVFEAAFSTQDALAFADILLPISAKKPLKWRMIEVKSSTSVKDYHLDDAAIQAYIAKKSGVALSAIAIAHIDSSWVYPGDNDYRGILVEEDLSEHAFACSKEVEQWITQAQATAAQKTAPDIETGAHCNDPYACGFIEHCQSQEPQAEHPISWLPRLSTKAKEKLAAKQITEMADVSDDLLNERQQRVKKATLSGKTYFNQVATAQALAAHPLPAYFIDFETIQFSIPIWAGTRPYQQIPFQFSVHQLNTTGKLTQQAFLDISGQDPSYAFAQALIQACGTSGAIFVYNAGFENARMRELATRFPELEKPLKALIERVVDLLPLARAHYYHPSMCGSWSIKALLPALCPELRYSELEGVQDGGMAQAAFLEAISPNTSTQRKATLEKQLLAYCELDTFAMVRIWEVFSKTKIKY